MVLADFGCFNQFMSQDHSMNQPLDHHVELSIQP